MKKLTLILAIVLGMTLGALAQNNSSTLFQNPNDGDSQSLFEYLQDLFETEEDATEAFAIENVGGGMLGGGGMFQRGAIGGEQTLFNNNRGGILNLPSAHGVTNDQDVPLGSGIALLLGLGGAYLVAKKRKEKA